MGGLRHGDRRLPLPDALRIRHGGNHDLTLPRGAIASITHHRTSLTEPICGYTAMSFYVDDPKKLVAAARD